MTSPEEHTGKIQSKVLLQSIIDLNSFEGKPSEFLNLLINTKRLAVGASASALVKKTGEKYGLLAASPPLKNNASPPWMQKALDKLSKLENVENVYCHRTEDDQQGMMHYIVFVPLSAGSPELGVEAYSVYVKDLDDLNGRMQKLQILLPYYNFYERNIQLKEFRHQSERMFKAFDVIIKLNIHESFLGSLMGLCNELAARWSCSRVSFGVQKRRYIKIKAMSNSEKFNRKTDIVRNLEKAMEECADQNLEILFPQEGDGAFVARQASSFSDNHGPVSLVSIPFRKDGKVFGVLTFERSIDKPFSKEDVEVFRLIADLYTPRLESLKKKDRFMFAKIADEFRQFFALLIGAKHTWLKLIIFAVIGVVWWLSQAMGMYQVEATFTFEASDVQTVSAPFSAEISKIHVENGEEVKEGDLLFVLDSTEMRLKRNTLLSRKLEAQKKAAVALREGEAAEEQIARAEVKGIDSEIELAEYFISQSTVSAPLGGIIVSDDLNKKEFSVIDIGKPLLEIVDDSALEIILFVPEDQIADVSPGKTGELAAAGYPNKKIKFIVQEIEKIAKVVAGQNVFRVKAEFLDGKKPEWLKTGMEGVARINVEQRLHVWIWTRKAINWLRMKFWF